MTIWRWNESPATLETLTAQASDHTHKSLWQDIDMPHPDDGLPLFLSATVCLFGSWVGSNKGAT